MKLLRTSLAFLLSFPLFFCFRVLAYAQQKPTLSQNLLQPFRQPTAKIIGKVIDENGVPLGEAEVTIDFLIGQENGWGTRDLTHKGLTGNDGTFTTSEQSGGTAVLSAIKIGCYKTVTDYYTFNKKNGGRWEPWNPTVEMVLKPIVNPIPMYARRVDTIDIPTVGQPVGFDLIVSDWVNPYGKGKTSDFIFLLDKDYTSINLPFQVTLTIRFANEDDGIQSVIAPINVGSELRLPRYAPEEGYQPVLVKSSSRKAPNAPIQQDYRDDQNYFFRVRTVKKDGKIESAHYGKIERDIEFWGNEKVRFIYYLNPTPNDRNMEFDPKRNLFTELTHGERVTAP